MDLSPKFCQTVSEGDGGSYHSWSESPVSGPILMSTSRPPLLRELKVGAGKLILKPLGFALPHYADSTKVGYVLHGCGMAGLILPEDPKEKIIALKEGDTILVPFACTSWWYNDGEAELAIVYVGDTSTSNNPGDFTYSFLTGSRSIFTCMSTNFISKAWNITEEEAMKIFGSQPASLIVKLEEKLLGLHPMKAKTVSTLLNVTNSVLMSEANFFVDIVKLGCNGTWGPGLVPYPAVQVIYVIKGSGRLQIVGNDASRMIVLDTEVKEGCLFVVPKFFVATAIAGDQGMDWFSITTGPKPILTSLAGKKSILNAISPQILGASLNVNQELVKLLKECETFEEK